ncbi:DNA polymerase IV [Halovenus sp. WSH3]|uniref:DNA polymerase IV n=1 Tax=Halovenus carboxidivorans TaxID=2692199 RepID=A0A6B0TDS8_9EURY|nr:DNA polymerase IV [Halovenus carboxidivorans]MXR51349.1 DNA polymerase IV [Halovenus carboxidivorans]
MERGRLPGVSAPEQIVCHADMDCFYAACERLREPALRGEPVVVGMGYEPGTTNGAVATASYEAREFGVESAQAISEALELLPRKIDAARNGDSVAEAGFYRPVDMEYYESVAADVREILHEHAETVREVSIDEAYLDLTDRVDWADVEEFGRRLKATIESEVGVTASLGIAPTMSAAKVASDHDKPDGLVVVEPGEVRAFLADLPVEDVHGVGPVTAARMRELGIDAAGDLAAADPATLESEFGERGRRVHRFARGEDERAVEPKGRPKSFSRESAFHEPTDDETAQYDRIERLATAVAQRAERRDVLYQTIGIKAVAPPFEVRTRARSLPGPVADEALLQEVAAELFGEFAGQRLRKVGVRVSNLSFGADEQPSLSAFGGDDGEDPDPDGQRQRSLTEFE